MPAKSFLRRRSDGRTISTSGVVTSAGVANDGDIPSLDPSGKLDPSVMPTGFGQNTQVVQASENLAAGDLVNIWDSTGARARKADATSEGKEAMGFVLGAVTSGGNATVYLAGNRITGLTGLTIGARYYLSTTPGGRTLTAPSAAGNVSMMIGVALDTTTIIFEPEEPITIA